MQVIGLAGQAQVGKGEIVDYLTSDQGFVRYAFADPLYREVEEAFNLSEDTVLLRGSWKEKKQGLLSLLECRDPDFVRLALSLIYGPDSEAMEIPLNPRWILQVWGTEYRRAQNENYWIDKADQFIEAYISGLEYTDSEEDTERKMREINAANLPPDEYEAATNQLLETNHTYIREHPGVVIDGVRFHNEAAWVRALGGRLWHVRRHDRPDIDGLLDHESTQDLRLETGDKLILNTGTVGELRTGVMLALRGNDIVKTGPSE